jgi:hypothetical protein
MTIRCLFNDDVKAVVLEAIEQIEIRLKRELTDLEVSILEDQIENALSEYCIGEYSNYN